jgi:hypothetical protein
MKGLFPKYENSRALNYGDVWLRRCSFLTLMFYSTSIVSALAPARNCSLFSMRYQLDYGLHIKLHSSFSGTA